MYSTFSHNICMRKKVSIFKAFVLECFLKFFFSKYRNYLALPLIIIKQFLPEKVFRNLIFFFFLKAAPAAYGSSQARGQIRVAAAGLHHSHSNARSELHMEVPRLGVKSELRLLA